MFKPCGFMVLIKPDDVETKSPGGIILTVDEKKESMNQVYGTIIDIGPSAWKAFDDGEPWAKVGDKVMYSKYGGKLVIDRDTGTKYVILRDEDVLAVVDSSDKYEDVDNE